MSSGNIQGDMNIAKFIEKFHPSFATKISWAVAELPGKDVDTMFDLKC